MLKKTAILGLELGVFFQRRDAKVLTNDSGILGTRCHVWLRDSQEQSRGKSSKRFFFCYSKSGQRQNKTWKCSRPCCLGRCKRKVYSASHSAHQPERAALRTREFSCTLSQYGKLLSIKKGKQMSQILTAHKLQSRAVLNHAYSLSSACMRSLFRTPSAMASCSRHLACLSCRFGPIFC